MPITPSARHRRAGARRRLAALAAATALLAAGGVLGTPAALGTSTATAPAREGEEPRIVSQTWLDRRTVDLTVRSPAVGAELPVRVVLPAGFDARPDRTWPVLYLLQGAHDDYTSWARETDAEDFLADKGVITVMPSSGPTGIPTAWWQGGRPAAPDYETFQVEEVMRLLRENFRASGTRAVAGVSTGGYGALAFAARHPGSFGAAASYSGVLDTTAPGMPTVVRAIVAREGRRPFDLWGDALLQRHIWAAHNPYAQAGRLAGTRLYISQGSGLPGGDFGNLEGAVLEGTLWGQARRFTRQLDRLGIPAEVHLYSGGSHAWRYWQREFRASWPVLAAGLGVQP